MELILNENMKRRPQNKVFKCVQASTLEDKSLLFKMDMELG